MVRPFRMWLFPLPALLAIGGFLFILLARQNFMREIRYALAILLIGTCIYVLRAWQRREWPFANRTASLSHLGHRGEDKK